MTVMLMMVLLKTSVSFIIAFAICRFLCFTLHCRTKALVLELLAAVCLVSGGHQVILNAFDNFKEVTFNYLICCDLI